MLRSSWLLFTALNPAQLSYSSELTTLNSQVYDLFNPTTTNVKSKIDYRFPVVRQFKNLVLLLLHYFLRVALVMCIRIEINCSFERWTVGTYRNTSQINHGGLNLRLFLDCNSIVWKRNWRFVSWLFWQLLHAFLPSALTVLDLFIRWLVFVCWLICVLFLNFLSWWSWLVGRLGKSALIELILGLSETLRLVSMYMCVLLLLVRLSMIYKWIFITI